MMTMEQFAGKIKNRIETILSGYRIELKQIEKNNGVQMTGLVFRKETEPVSSVLFLEPYHSQYLNGRCMEKVVEEIVSAFHKDMAPPMPLSQMKDVLNWDQAKDRVVYRLVHAGQNKKQLDEAPSTGWLDLAIVYYLYFEQEDGQVYIAVTNGFMEVWGIGREELHRHAEQNMPKLLPEVLESLQDVLFEQDAARMSKEAPMTIPVYVLTNKTGSYGAAAMLYGDSLKRMAKKWNSDVLILPSSINEVLLLSDAGGSYEVFRNMVCEINRDVVGPEICLSSNVYRYSRKTEEIAIVGGEGAECDSKFSA